MERTEPSLVPEWLRNSGSTTGGGNSAHHAISSSCNPDGPLLAKPTRNRSFRSISESDSPRSAFLDRSTSSNSRKSLNTNSTSKHPYGSFSRSHRDKDRDREKERLAIGDHWDPDGFDPLGKDMLRRSRSMVSRKKVELLPRRGAFDYRNGGNSTDQNGNGVISGGSIGSSVQKVAFEKDFPSLVNEDKQGLPDVGRVSSAGLTAITQSLPIGNSALMGGEGWSALAEVPMVIGSNSMGPPSGNHSAAATSAGSGSGTSSTISGLNMAEALTQAPLRAHTAPQLSVETQRLEELALKQSRQLIPMTPSMPKALASSLSDKAKPKASVRSNEIIGTTKSGQRQLPALSQLNVQSPRGGQVRSDPPKASQGGKYLVLKPVWENGTSVSLKDVSGLPNNVISKVVNSQLAVPSGSSAPLRSPNGSKPTSVERKATPSPKNVSSIAEKRPLSSQAKSRNDFFNLMRQKTSGNNSALPAMSSPTVDKSDEVINQATSAPVSPHAIENGELISNGNAPDGQRFSDNGEKVTIDSSAVYPDEEEAAFLRSLGWDENAGDDEGLTQEEINAFYQDYMKLRPPTSLHQGTQSKPESQSSSSDSGSEA